MKSPIKNSGQKNAPRSPAPVNRNLTDLVARRIRHVGLALTPSEQVALVAYLQHLALWNRTINLTAFDLERPIAEAIDRLVVEPWIAARHLTPADQMLIDIGSGAGSPALPIKIAASWLRVILVESKTRKATFLRDVIRELGLTAVEVDARRAEEVSTRPDVVEAADVISIRAVRLDPSMWRTIHSLLRLHGRVFLFSRGPLTAAPPQFAPVASASLPRGELHIIRKIA